MWRVTFICEPCNAGWEKDYEELPKPPPCPDCGGKSKPRGMFQVTPL